MPREQCPTCGTPVWVIHGEEGAVYFARAYESETEESLREELRRAYDALDAVQQEQEPVWRDWVQQMGE